MYSLCVTIRHNALNECNNDAQSIHASTSYAIILSVFQILKSEEKGQKKSNFIYWYQWITTKQNLTLFVSLASRLHPNIYLLHPCHKQQQTLLSWRSNQIQTSCLQGIGGRTDHRDNGSFFQSDLKPARQLSTCDQWAGIPYRRHFRMLMYFVSDIYNSVWMLGQVTEIMYWSFHGKQHQDVVTPTYPLPSFTVYVNVSLICWSPLKVNHHPMLTTWLWFVTSVRWHIGF